MASRDRVLKSFSTSRALEKAERLTKAESSQEAGVTSAGPRRVSPGKLAGLHCFILSFLQFQSCDGIF